MVPPATETFADKFVKFVNDVLSDTPLQQQAPAASAVPPHVTPADEQAALTLVAQAMVDQGIVALTPEQAAQAVHLAQLMVISAKLGEEKARRIDEHNALLSAILTSKTNRDQQSQDEIESAVERERLDYANHLNDLIHKAREEILKEATWAPPVRVVKDVTPVVEVPERRYTNGQMAFFGGGAMLVLLCAWVVWMYPAQVFLGLLLVAAFIVWLMRK